MELISSGQSLAAGAQVNALPEALEVTLSSVFIFFFFLVQPFQRLGQQARDRGLALDSEKFDLEQDLFGKCEADAHGDLALIPFVTLP
jgi:hypothetical protein